MKKTGKNPSPSAQTLSRQCLTPPDTSQTLHRHPLDTLKFSIFDGAIRLNLAFRGGIKITHIHWFICQWWKIWSLTVNFGFPPRRKSLGEIQSDALLGTAAVGFQDILHDWAILHQWIIGSIPLLLHLQNSKCWHIFMPCLWWDLQRLDWCEENKAINLSNWNNTA